MLDLSDESEQYGGDDYGDQAGGGSMPSYDTMYHTRFYHQKNSMDVQVSL